MAECPTIPLGEAFVQQRDLQGVSGSAPAASSADLDRGSSVAGANSLRFADVGREVHAYLARGPGRRTVLHTATSSARAAVLG